MSRRNKHKRETPKPLAPEAVRARYREFVAIASLAAKHNPREAVQLVRLAGGREKAASDLRKVLTNVAMLESDVYADRFAQASVSSGIGCPPELFKNVAIPLRQGLFDLAAWVASYTAASPCEYLSPEAWLRRYDGDERAAAPATNPAPANPFAQANGYPFGRGFNRDPFFNMNVR